MEQETIKMTDSEEKPDGWVAWHPKLGALIKTARITTREVKHAATKCQHPHLLERFAPWDSMEDLGYKIRPVKLQFLDEEKK